MKQVLTQRLARKHLHYDPDTGLMTWRLPTKNGMKPGAPFGSPVANQRGRTYLRGYIFGKKHRVHRVIWLYMTGKWPKDQVDHRNGDGIDNRWSNLREATFSQQRQNVGVTRANKLGIKGVKPMRERFQARITANGQRIHLGTFDTPKEGELYR